MSFGDDFEENEENNEVGSDELLSDDNLRLPEGASPLVRLHAVRAWLTRRQQETEMEIGNAALSLQQLMEDEPQVTSRLRRRERQDALAHVQQAQQELQQAQQRLSAYDEARDLLEDCITHTTPGERALVEYYLSLEEIMSDDDSTDDVATTAPRRQALMDVQHRVEHVTTPYDDEA